MHEPGATVIVCADDFGLTDAVSEGVLALLDKGRLSATGAMTTMPGWPRFAGPLRAVRDTAAIGLHLNLTLGEPAGMLPALAPGGRFPALRRLLLVAFAGRIDTAEVAGEIERQLDRFEAGAGAPPDYVDGHEHVHVLPGIRHALFAVLARRYPGWRLLVRDPSDRLAAILARKTVRPKALFVSMLARGLRDGAERRGLATNIGFSGFSSFGRLPFGAELDTNLRARGPCHIVMCHPGLGDRGDSQGDPIAARRAEEYAVLAGRPDLPAIVWRPVRSPETGQIAWPDGRTPHAR
jgi:predicted glycoside hydrolase/deacetylase ChbG (UPF0249 family)